MAHYEKFATFLAPLALAFVAALGAPACVAPTGAGDSAGSEPADTPDAPAPPDNGVGAPMCPAHPPKVENNHVMVWDEATGAYAELFVKAMAYSPESASFVNATTAGAAGTLCRQSGNLGTAAGSFSLPSCFDSDYAGNLVSHDRTRVVNGDFRAAWQRDMDAMKEMGVNTIRLYNADPQFRDHKSFLDDAHARGMMVMFPAWFIPYNADPGFPFERTDVRGDDLPILAAVDAQLAEIASHPAVLLWTVGNELVTSYVSPTSLDQFRLGRIGRIMDQIHSVCGGKLLVTNVPQDLGDGAPNWEAYAASLPQQDVFTVNAGYRGDPDGGNSYDRLFPLVKSLTTSHQKPFILGEAGEYDDIPLGAAWFDSLLVRIKANPDANIVGATFFEYSDEPKAKAGSDQQHMGVVRLEASGATPALDAVVVRKARHDMIKSAFSR